MNASYSCWTEIDFFQKCISLLPFSSWQLSALNIVRATFIHLIILPLMVICNKYWPSVHDVSYFIYDRWPGHNSAKQLSFNQEVETSGRLQVKKITLLYRHSVINKLLAFTSTTFRLSQHIVIRQKYCIATLLPPYCYFA